MKDPVEARVKYHIRDKRVNDLYRCSFVYENKKPGFEQGFEQMKGLLDKLMHIEHEATIKDKQPSIEPAPTEPAPNEPAPTVRSLARRPTLPQLRPVRNASGR